MAEEQEIEKLQNHLKAFGGKESIDEDTKVYRQVVGNVVPLGIGLTENPAADVMGVITEEKEETLAKTAENTDNISQNEENNVISKESNTTMKINSVNDITNDLLKEVEASVVADFIEEELKQASEKFTEESNKLKVDLEEAREQRETLSKDHEDLKTKLEEVEKTLADLEEEKAVREAEAKFNERMSLLDEEYQLNDEDREVIASDIKDMDEEGFESYQKRISVLLKDKSKAAIEAKATEAAKAEEAKQEEVKASEEEKEDVVETAVDEAEKSEDEIPNSIQAEDESFMDKYKAAFSLDQFELK